MKPPTTSLILLLSFTHKITADELNFNFLQSDYDVQFQRMELTRYNRELVRHAALATYKHNRSVAVVNATFRFKENLGFDIEATLQFYKFMSNEYRIFPIRFEVSSCKSLQTDIFGIGSAMNRCGNFTGCPYRKEVTYYFCKLYLDASKFPPLIPSGQFKIEIQLSHASKEVGILTLFVEFSRPVV